MQREHFSSRFGFILISAGCAIGLGNVWRFPFVVGKYGGGAFVLLYLIFLAILGLPILAMEFSVGRASQQSGARSFAVLEPKGTKWHWFGPVGVVGNYLLMMFYTTVGGWMIAYVFKSAAGMFEGRTVQMVGQVFTAMQQNPWEMIGWMILAVFLGLGICSMGLQKGVERITKVMMSCLLFIMAVLCVRSLTLPGAADGLRFYLLPDFHKMVENGIAEVIYSAMGQAFFTLSVGIGSMAIFGSYISRDRRLMGESINICVLDTFVALLAGLIIFPACFSFGVEPDSGPMLVFITLPNIFNQMAGGRLWGTLFFIFMSFAALSTIVAVFENIISFGIDLWGWSRKKAVLINAVLIVLLSLPCVLGFNVLSGIQPLGPGSNIQDLEDFIVSNNLLPLGSICYLMFCISKKGWGWKNFLNECDSGVGVRFPRWSKWYLKWVLPVIMAVIFIIGYYQKFFA